MPADTPRDLPMPPYRFQDGAGQTVSGRHALSASPARGGMGASASPIPTEQAGGPVVGWQPIETHDGSEDHVLIADAEGNVVEARLLDDGRGWWARNNDPTDHWGEEWFPTHWMPLPPAPSTTSTAEQVAFSASDRACYEYPGVDEQPLRAAFVAGAVFGSSAPSPGEGDAPVAWRFMLDGGWQYSAIDPRPHISGTVEPLFTRPTPATPEGLREKVVAELDELITHIVAIGPEKPELKGTDREYEIPMSRRVWREVFADRVLSALQPQAQGGE